MSIVVTIFKKQSSIKLDNIRLIILLSVYSKLIEKLIKVRLAKYLNSILFFSNEQFGFRQGKLPETLSKEMLL